MTRLELELDGVTVTARLLNEDAPRTCGALWDALPFEALVVHSRWAGARLHTLTHPKIDVGPISYPFIENPSAYQAPRRRGRLAPEQRVDDQLWPRQG